MDEEGYTRKTGKILDLIRVGEFFWRGLRWGLSFFRGKI